MEAANDLGQTPAVSRGWEAQFQRALNGSREAQAKLLESLRPYLLAVAEDQLASDLRPKLAASDVTQITVWQAWQDFGEFRGQTRAELVGWLRTILGHCVAAGARQYRETAKRDLDRERSLERMASEFGAALVASGASPSEYAVASESRQQFEKAAQKLSPRHEQAILLRSNLGLSFAEIGTVMSCSEDAARMLWVRALEKLGRELRSHDES